MGFCSTSTVDMESNVLISCFFLALIGSLEAVLWSSKNCNPNGDDRNVVKGKVTDAICCGSTHMAEAHSKCNVMDKNSCNAEDTCKWHDPSRNIKCRTAYSRLLPECQERPSCKLNRDSRNNVCCKNPELEKLDNCVDMMAGRCPSAWQVPRDCCPAPNDKYAFMLTTDPSRSDLVCCNAPCTAIEQAWRGEEGNVTAGVAPVPGKTQCRADGVQMPAAVKENCAPAKRSLLAGLLGGGGGLGGGLGGLGGLGGGMDPSMISQLLGMPTGAGDSLDLGKVIPGMAANTGLDGGATLAALQGLGFGSSKDSHVDEITVDDFFDSIIEALDNDKDVFEYNKEINSDSWFGKQSFGGLVDGFKFINPNKFINRIYGSPFGLANAQAMFGMQYGIPMDKFQKHTGYHQVMTGYANPYGPPPPSYHPPTPPPYSPPVYPGPYPEPHPEPAAEPVPEPEYHQPVYQPYPEPYPQPVYQPYPEPEYQQPVYQPYPQQYPEPYPEPQPYNPYGAPPPPPQHEPVHEPHPAPAYQ